MKSIIRKNIIYTMFSIFAAILTLSACKRDEELGKAPRLFRPSIKGELLSTGNFIEASWQNVKGASSYTIQISRDTFKTVDVSLDVDSNATLVEDLAWDQLYQVQVRANAADSSGNSKFGILGLVKTPKFPSILLPSTINDVTDNSVIMRWNTVGEVVSEIKVFDGVDKSLVKSVNLNAADVSNGYKVIGELNNATSYYLELYSGSTLRGYETYITKAPFAGEVIDLRQFADRPSVLQDTLPNIPSGSTVILKKGATYTIETTVNLSKTVTITSGDDLLVQEPANIFFTNNFNFTEGSTIDSISFINVNLRSDNYSGRYVFNTNKGATVGKIKFDNCKIEIFRGIVRLQSGNTTLSNYEINNCLIDSISGYGMITVDNASCKAENIIIRNSTISRSEVVIASSKRESNSVMIENCTFYRAPRGGSYLIDYNTFTVTSGIRIVNSIFSIGKSNSGNTSPRGVRSNGTLIHVSNNFSTSDFVSGGNPVPEVVPYSRPSTELFTDPFSNNFKIKDAGFPGRSTSGDPRWRL